MTAARAYLGVPFLHQGRSRHGLDCVGLLVLAAADRGITIEDDPRYPGHPPVALLTRQLKKNLAVVRNWKADLRIADIVRFKDRELTHVGIVADRYRPFSVIHVSSRSGCVEVRLDFGTVHTVFRYPKWRS